MRPRERRESGQTDLWRSRLDQILDMDHPLVKLTRSIDWGFLEERLGEVYDDGPGQPPLPTRLMAGLAILKSMHNLSDEGPVRALGGEPLLPAVLRRGVLPAPAAVRPHLNDALAPAHGRGAADGTAAGKPCRGDTHGPSDLIAVQKRQWSEQRWYGISFPKAHRTVSQRRGCNEPCAWDRGGRDSPE